MLNTKGFTFNPIQENTYVVWDEDTLETAIIDPGCYDKDEEDQLSDFILKQRLRVKYILNTHTHVDHVLGNYFCQQTFKKPLLIHKEAEVQLRAVDLYAPVYGIHNYQINEPDGYLVESQIVELGKSTLKVLFVPGHAPGHVAFYSAADGVVFGGDVLFYNSVGRTDLEGGNFQLLEQSIRNVLYKLPDKTVVYSGHGPNTSIGHERITNPYVSE
jgi:hydroxyacylglutathione hydrolase